MKIFLLFIGWLAAMAAGAAGAAGADEPQPRLQNTFFVFCHDTHDAKKRNYAEQAEMISDLGFDGVGHLRLKGLPERLATLDQKGLKLVWLHDYVTDHSRWKTVGPVLRRPRGARPARSG